jgi:hypothetical protein
MTQEERDEIRQMIEDAVASTLNRSTLPICQVESKRMETLEKMMTRLNEIVVGNGHVEDSLLWISRQNRQELEAVKKIADRRGKERDNFSIFIYYLTDKILPSLITTGILAFIYWQWALSHAVQIP